jgi:hypothetical protein
LYKVKILGLGINQKQNAGKDDGKRKAESNELLQNAQLIN